MNIYCKKSQKLTSQVAQSAAGWQGYFLQLAALRLQYMDQVPQAAQVYIVMTHIKGHLSLIFDYIIKEIQIYLQLWLYWGACAHMEECRTWRNSAGFIFTFMCLSIIQMWVPLLLGWVFLGIENLYERALYIRKILLTIPRLVLIVMRYLFAFLNQ